MTGRALICGWNPDPLPTAAWAAVAVVFSPFISTFGCRVGGFRTSRLVLAGSGPDHTSWTLETPTVERRASTG